MPIDASKPQTPVPKSAFGIRHSAFRLSLLLVTGLLGLYLSDRALRRMEKMDDVVLRGQRGLAWIDDFLARRAGAMAKGLAYEAELKRLVAAVTAAQATEQRIAANYAVAKLEGMQGRYDNQHIQAAWVAITRAGG